MDYKKQLDSYIKEIEFQLEEYLPKGDEVPSNIIEAMKYSLLAGGKRIRPILLLEATQCIGYDKQKAMPLACAIEMIHTYSLIHDDLPSMDNDDFRRGKLTNHKVYGEGLAILTGDALLNYAFELMMNHVPKNPEEMVHYIQAVQEIVKASGIKGMIGGQVVDLEYENKEMGLNTLQYIHSHKTGALIIAALRGGAICAGADEQQLQAFTLFGEKIGLAFQIVDDILDVIGDQEKLGKPTGSDEKNQKLTYPAIYGLKRSQEMLGALLEDALQKLKIFGNKGKFLSELGIFICKRDY